MKRFYSIWKGEGWLLTINKQYLMKKSIPFGKEGNDFSLSINSIWWNVYSIWKGDGLPFAINKQCLMKKSIPFGKERDDFSLSINSIWWKGSAFSLSINSMMKRSFPFGKERWLLASNKQYLMKRSIPFGKERDDFSLSINSIWWNGLFHFERRGMTFRYR